MRVGHAGTGPGAITPDGCAVELYARIPAGEEPDIIERAVAASARILELGCGVGRVTHPLTTAEFEQALLEAGLVVDTYLTEDRTWVRALPVAGAGTGTDETEPATGV